VGDAYPWDEYRGRDTRFQSEIERCTGDVLGEWASPRHEVVLQLRNLGTTGHQYSEGDRRDFEANPGDQEVAEITSREYYSYKDPGKET